MKLKGVIFDLDGTLVESRLDFDRMREEIGIVGRRPVLEFVESLAPGPERDRAMGVILAHELRGAQEATLIPGVPDLLRELRRRGLELGILTRNLRETTDLTLSRLGLDGFSQVLTRGCAPPKPSPEGVFRICEAWGCSPAEVVFIGDFLFDLLAGRNAGSKAILYATSSKPLPEFASLADHVFSDFFHFSSEFSEVMGKKFGFES